MHFPVNHQLRRALAHQRQRLTHFARRRGFRRTKVRVRQQRHLRLDTKAAHGLCGHHGDLRQLVRGRIVVNVGVSDKGVPARQQQGVHRPGGMDAVAIAEDLLHHAKVLVVIADGAADQRIRLAAMHHDRADHRGVADDGFLRLLLGDPTALHDRVVFAPVLFEARIGFVVDDLEVDARLNLQAQLLDTHFNHARTTNQDWFRQA